MATLQTQYQDPGEVVRYDIDFIDDMASADTIAACSWAITTTALIAPLVELPQFSGTRTAATVSGLTMGELYRVEVTVTTVAGEVRNASFYLRAVNR